jgi:hypothetical protein
MFFLSFQILLLRSLANFSAALYFSGPPVTLVMLQSTLLSHAFLQQSLGNVSSWVDDRAYKVVVVVALQDDLETNIIPSSSN